MPSPFDATQVAPWRTWGNTGNVRVFGNPGPVAGEPQQLVNVEFDRPDTWSWFVALTLSPDLSNFFSIPGANPTAEFDFTFGVGRANIRIPSFVHMEFSASTLSNGAPQLVCFANTYSGGNGVNPGTDPSPLGDTVRTDIRDIPAQSIQITGRVNFPSLVGFIDCEFTAFAAPRSHFRREWVVDDTPDWARPVT